MNLKCPYCNQETLEVDRDPDSASCGDIVCWSCLAQWTGQGELMWSNVRPLEEMDMI